MSTNTIRLTLDLNESTVDDLRIVAANCNLANQERNGCTSHGELDVPRLLRLLAEAAAAIHSRPGSWEGAGMDQVLVSHGYY